MEMKGQYVCRRTEDAFDIDADKNLYRQIVDDMIKNAGNFIPRSNWQKLYDDRNSETFREGSARHKEVQYTDEQILKNAYDVLERYHNMRIMMAAWVGVVGEKDKLQRETVTPYSEFLSELDPSPQLLDALMENIENTMLADFKTAEEITMIQHITKDIPKLNMLEIGGGYGRLAEGFMNVYGHEQIHCVLADSVPASIMYCYLYLRKSFPHLKIGIYYEDPKASSNDFDIYIVPTWHLESVCSRDQIQFNLLVNIQSMQEMSQWHVDYYLNLFDKIGADNAIVFLDNNKKWTFQGSWNYPKNWRLLFRQNTPSSWSDDCPTEIFVKDKGDFTAYNDLINLPHRISQQKDKKISNLKEHMDIYRAREIELSSRDVDKLSWAKILKMKLFTR